MTPIRVILVALVALRAGAPGRAAQPLSVAAAANLSIALEALDAEFKGEHPDVAVTSATGASGDLVAQIEHGAPYDVFLSADLHFAQKLAKDGSADPKSLSVFAVGALVLWTTRDALPLADVARVVRDPAVKRLAIANTVSAPFGRAARQALEKLGAWDEAQPKLVVGESISQTTQFVETGNADAGFVALSVVLSTRLKDRGRYIEVPANLYEPLDQGAVVTAHGAGNASALLYVDFLGSPQARKILGDFGYRIPAPKS
ncbi:MAG TPA: molybdate ABC transporter substrate-binding protein [Opitutaceae bacterium]